MIRKRPLTGEPLALDLVNTVWTDGGATHDLLASEDGAFTWLEEVGLAEAGLDPTSVLAALLEARSAIRAVLEEPESAEAQGALNAVLARGRTLERLGPAGAETVVEVSAPWRAAFLAARSLLELWRTAPGRVKACAGRGCTLYFLDTSPKNARKWHDMKTCGNRAKASRHHRRAVAGQRPPAG